MSTHMSNRLAKILKEVGSITSTAAPPAACHIHYKTDFGFHLLKPLMKDWQLENDGLHFLYDFTKQLVKSHCH